MKNLQLLVAILLGIVTLAANADQIELELEHDQVTRSYLLYLPASYQQGTALPLLLALHGRSGNGQRMARLTAFNPRADKHGFIVLYPQGIENQWNYLHGLSASHQQPNDPDFLLKLVDAVTDRYSIDTRRIYVTGISNGGFMAQRLACDAPDRFAAFASVAAGGYAVMPNACNNGGPVNMLYMHGTADTKVPWRGLGIQDESGKRQLVAMSISNSVKFWSARNRCSPDVDSRELPPQGDSPGTSVRILAASECAGGSEVILFAILGGGHNWPGVPDFIPAAIAGAVNLDVHASDVIWSFFSSKSLQ